MAFDLVGKAVKKLRLPTVNYDNTPIKIIPAQQGDVNSRYFVVELYDDRGDIVLSPYSKVMLNATLPDESLQVLEGEIDKSKNLLLIKIAGSMITMSGKVVCDISLQGTDSNGDAIFLTSQTFYIFVAVSQSGDEAIEGDDNYSLLVQLLSDVSTLENDVKTAESSRVKAEIQREQDFSEAKTNCENATTRAVEVTETMLEMMDSLPRMPEVQDEDTTENIVLLRFVKNGG